MQLYVLSLIISNHFLSYIVRIKAVIVHIFIQGAKPENLGPASSSNRCTCCNNARKNGCVRVVDPDWQGALTARKRRTTAELGQN